MELPEWATRRIGPLPVWGWGVAGLGTFGVVWYLHRRSAATATATDTGATAVPIGSGGGGDGGGGGGQPFDPSGLLATITSQQQASQAAMAALQQQFSQQLGDLAGGVTQSEQALQQQFAAGLAANQQAQAQAQSGFQAQLAALLAQAKAPTPSTVATVTVPYAGGGTAQVPAAVAASGNQTPLGNKTSGPAYVAGTQPATAQSPTGGGTWQGLNDQQTKSLFQATYGSNWQAVWQQQHAAQVAANGG